MLKSNFLFKNLDEKEKKFAQNYFQSKIKKIENKLKNFHNDLNLEVRVEKFPRKSAYKVSFALNNPNIFTSEDDHTINEAMDFALDKFILQVRKILEKRKERKTA